MGEKVDNIINQFNLPDYILSILKYLKDNGSASQKELIEKSNLPVRKVRYGLRRLKEEQLISSKPDLMDMRSLKYVVNDQMEDAIREVLHNKANV